MRPRRERSVLICSSFQFTHPGRGATAPSALRRASASKFQFTHPGRGATDRPIQPTRERAGFQFTHPGRGATDGRTHRGADVRVSIHAPREGCDYILLLLFRRGGSFNSRTPGGVRQQYSGFPCLSQWFQFTHPGRGATPHSTLRHRGCTGFNSRTPGGVRLLPLTRLRP